MKPSIEKANRSKPTPRLLTDTAALFRLRRHLATKDLMIVTRFRSPLGPVFTLDTDRGVVVDRNIQTLPQLAKRYGLLKPGERA